VLREVFVLRSTEILPAFLVLFVSASTVALFDTEPGMCDKEAHRKHNLRE
jgi:hypothetical protein